MSSVYQGTRAIQASVSTAGVGSSINCTNHGFAIGDRVHIFDNTDNPQINGPATVSAVISANIFSIANSSTTALPSGGASGSVTVSRPSITIPSGGDTRNATSVNVPFEGLSDAIADLVATQGKYYLVDIGQTRSLATVAMSGTLAALSSLGTTPAFSNVAENDVIETTLAAGVVTSFTGAGTSALVLELYENFAGGGYGANIYTPQGTTVVTAATITQSNYFTLVGYTLIATPGTYAAQLWGSANVTGTTVSDLVSISATQKLWRPR